MSNSSTPVPQVLLADQEHNALRLLVPLLLLAGFCLGFFMVLALLDALAPAVDSRVFLACVAAVPLGLGLTYGVEKILKRVWPSGMKVALENDGLTLINKDSDFVKIDRSKSLNLMLWYFPLSEYPRGGRERRVPGSWFCLAASLKQDDNQIIFHCFAPSAKKEEWVKTYTFHALDPADVYDTSLMSRVTIPSRPELPADVIAGKDGRYWLAERERWQHGIELAPNDFGQFLAHIYEFDIHY